MKSKTSAKTVYTHITVVLDRTGSMETIRDDTIGGFNAFLGKQRKEPGKATLTLVQFDSQDPYEVLCRFSPLTEVEELTRESYVPRASTPLLDAMGRAINDLEKSLAGMKKAERPAKIVVVVVTDGQENASREFTKAQVEKMVKEKREKEDWQFVFLSADLAAIGEAMDLGFRLRSSLMFEKNGQGSDAAWNALAMRTACYRGPMACSMEFLDEDRHHPADPAKKE